MKSSNTLEFKLKAEKIHNFFYDYSVTDYCRATNKIKINCPIHGVFEQTPNSHLSGHGCPFCGVIKSNKNKKLTDFIDRSKKIHNDKYDYCLVEYKNTDTKVRIICPKHDIFEQKPYHHLNGIGCSFCSNRKMNTQIFINKSKIVHDNKYDYSLVEYKNTKTNVIIICPIHGKFNQRPEKHLLGQGCKMCNDSKGEAYIRKILKQENIKFNSQYIFENCRDIMPLPFDFFLPDYNLCIEYDGEQHFNPVKFFGGIDGLKDNVKKDNIKNLFCKNNNINLLRISYKDNLYDKMLDFIKFKKISK